MLKICKFLTNPNRCPAATSASTSASTALAAGFLHFQLLSMIEARATCNSVTQPVRIRSTPNHAVPDTPSLVLTCRTSRFETLPVLDDCSTLWIDSTKPVNIEWDPLFQKYCLHEIRFRTQANKSNGTTGPTSSSPLCSARSLSCARLNLQYPNNEQGRSFDKMQCRKPLI